MMPDTKKRQPFEKQVFRHEKKVWWRSKSKKIRYPDEGYRGK